MKQGRSASGAYVEFPMATPRADERVRVTHVETPRWHTTPTLRIQKVNARGYVFPGPEFPVEQAITMITAMALLIDGATKPKV